MAEQESGPGRGPARDLDYGEETDSNPDMPKRSRSYRLITWFQDNLMLIIAVGALAAFVTAAVLDYSLPRWLRIAGLSGAISGIVVGRPVARRAREMLWSPDNIWVVDVDAAYRKGGLFRIPSQVMRNCEIQGGSLDWVSPNLVFGKNVDVENMTIEGTWRGTLTDRELLSALHMVRECRQMLEADAKRGWVWENSAWMIVRKATMNALSSVSSTFEKNTMPDKGEGITEAVDTALEDFGLSRSGDGIDEESLEKRAEKTMEEVVDNSVGAPTGETKEVPADD